MDDVVTGTPNSLSKLSPGNISTSVLRPVSSISAPKSSPITSGEGWSTMNIVTVILIIILLAILGLNIFTHLAKGTDYVGWIVQKFSSKLPEKTKDLVNTTITGIDLGVDVAADTVKDVGNVLSRELNLKRAKLWEERDTGIKKGIEDRHIPGINKHPEHEPGYKEGSEDDNIQEKHKAGYCYIGTDRGYRTCIQVNTRDNCESRKIFPTMDICVNPSLRK